MIKIARMLLLVTILYNIVEGVIALWSGIAAGSIALVAFGADSYIEVAAASLVLWRLGISDTEYAEAVEHRIVRFIGWTFLVLSAAVSIQVGVGAGGSERCRGVAHRHCACTGIGDLYASYSRLETSDCGERKSAIYRD